MTASRVWAIALLVLPISLLATTAASQTTGNFNGVNDHNGVYVTSLIQPNGDGTATAVCSTNAADPSTKSPTATTAADYQYFSTECVVTLLDGSTAPATNGTDASSTAQCNTVFPLGNASALGQSYPDQGSGNAGNPYGYCTFNFPVKPGTTYTLTSNHFIWLYPPDQVHCLTGYLMDPQDFSDDWDNNFGSDGLSETYNVYNPANNVECMLQVNNDPPGRYLVGNSLQVATTQAVFTAVLVNPGIATFYQTQNYELSSNLTDLSTTQNDPDDKLNWCVRASSGICGTADVTSPALQGSFDGAGTVTVPNAGNTQEFYAPDTINGSNPSPLGPNLTIPAQEYICAQETDNSLNSTCATVYLTELTIYIIPSPLSPSYSMPPGQTRSFTAELFLSSKYPPANAVSPAAVSWNAWGADPSCTIGCSQGAEDTIPGVAYSTFNYQTPGFNTTAYLTAGATVGGIGGPLSSTKTIEVSSTLSAQTVTFSAVPSQSAATTYSGLAATASSGLAVVFASDTPAVCSVIGSSATLITAGTCSIEADQSGNSTYSSATATRSFEVSLATQAITFPSIGALPQGSVFSLQATASSGLETAFNASTPATCSVSGGNAILVSVGICTIVASQAGNATYSAASTTQSFFVTGTAAAPIFSPAGGTFNSVPTVTISDASPGATVYFTTNGSTPTTSSTQYSGPITVGNAATVQAFASGGYFTPSSTASATYSLVALPPAFSPPAGTYPGPLAVTIASASPGVDIFYTTAGNLAGTSAPRYTAPITVTSTETLNAITAQTGWTTSADVAAKYTIEPYAATPSFSIAAGTYATAQTVTITDATAGATIYYTTDGTTPTKTSSVYSGPITVSASETLNVIAVANNYSNSTVATAAYTIQ